MSCLAFSVQPPFSSPFAPCVLGSLRGEGTESCGPSGLLGVSGFPLQLCLSAQGPPGYPGEKGDTGLTVSGVYMPCCWHVHSAALPLFHMCFFPESWDRI